MGDRLVVGISGASGAPLAIALLKALRETDFETHLIVSRGGEETIALETNLALADVNALADAVYDCNAIGAAPASGSFKTAGMIVVPCSMKTVAGIHSGYTDNLLLRAADVTLKERRRLLLVPRECPFSTIHLRNMFELSQMGVTLLPAMLSYYNHPESVEDMTNHIVGKLLDMFGIDYPEFRRWEG